ncbi:MAG: GDYXXLXY domain-containing protein [Candidatus Moraniibacteriota bacterium]
MIKKKAFIAIGIFWLILIGGFIGFKEFTLKTGDEVLLKIVPVDPRDLFRGDYVILSYEISTIKEDGFSVSVSDFKVGDEIYVSLSVNAEKIGYLLDTQKEKPKKGTFIKGTVKDIHSNSLTVEYGIESYFVPEGKGREIERNRKEMYSKVMIDKFGNAVLKALVLDGKEIVLN